MKITNIETILAGQRYLFVKVHTDTGLVGYGECGAWCYQEATAECIHAMEHHLIGLDPLNIEYINNGLTRCMHFRGSVVMAAISGIDIALWDLKGKYYNVPIYELLGGKVRDKARIYVNFKAKTPEDFAKKALDLKNQGYTAIRYSIGHPEDENGRCGENFSQVVYRMERQMAAIREAVGWEMDIAIECHRGLTPAQAIECAHALKPYRPYFYEDPIPDNMAAMTKLTEEIDLPVATGERFINLMEFDEFMTASHVRYVRPDMCVAGGITAGKKIAALAEAKSIYIIPHNPLGPISTAACLQLDACIPNFEIQEYPVDDEGHCRLDKEMKQPFVIKNGYIQIPDGPGLGIELLDDIGTVFPFKGRYGKFVQHEDGSIVDR